MKSYAVFRVDERDNRLERVGEVTLDEQSRLSLVTADASAETRLREAIEELNEADVLVRKVKPLEDAPRFSIRKEGYERGSEGFFEALQDNLRRWHNFELGEA
jgi:hypothetical protein